MDTSALVKRSAGVDEKYGRNEGIKGRRRMKRLEKETGT
jgi:hypothetical protein